MLTPENIDTVTYQPGFMNRCRHEYFTAHVCSIVVFTLARHEGCYEAAVNKRVTDFESRHDQRC